MKESTVEKYLVEQVTAYGGLCEKFVSPGRRDVPDRLVTWLHGCMDFIELKAPGKKPRAGQLRDHRDRAARGVRVLVIDDRKGVDDYIRSRYGYLE
jgi:hypothetical protein